MKRLTLALILGITSIGIASADSMVKNNTQQEDDAVYGYRNTGTPSQAEAPDLTAQRKNVQQEDDVIHGYRNSATASTASAPDLSENRKNVQQEDDKIYGYRK